LALNSTKKTRDKSSTITGEKKMNPIIKPILSPRGGGMAANGGGEKSKLAIFHQYIKPESASKARGSKANLLDIENQASSGRVMHKASPRGSRLEMGKNASGLMR
jgi:hypothetical protein